MRKRSHQKDKPIQKAAKEEKRRPNRLIHEKSPYLLQHAYNPVDWYPWSQEAFEKARVEDKPIFLSVGFATCHWCHVIAHESFEDSQVARLLNESFVSVKVDREERPDVDDLYMSACQMLTGGGGWPLTVILTPDKKPFFAGTYFPKEKRHGRSGMLDLIPRLTDLWANRRQDVLKSADQITAALGGTTARASAHSGLTLDSFSLDAAFTELATSFDHLHGGFGIAPKFPTPHNFTFLLRYWYRTGEDQALYMVEKTLQAMRRGGIWDHLSYGFHRYSTDERWLVPHFEKMLYDQALLAIAYLETFEIAGKALYRDTAQEIFDYILRNLDHPEGGFYCGEDADSEGMEGKFYLWTRQEIEEILGHQLADVFNVAYGVEPGGNFDDPHFGGRSSENILHQVKSLSELARNLKLPEEDLSVKLAQARLKLAQARALRVPPGRDDKILTDWNGLMIASLALGSRICANPDYARAADRAADFILNHLRTEEGRLLHRWRDGDAGLAAGLNDYAFLIWGFLELYEAGHLNRLAQALELTRQMVDHFWDGDRGGFFLTADDVRDLPMRRKDIYDGALPSGNSVAAMNLLRLGRITGNMDLEHKGQALFSTFADTVSRYPAGYTQLLSALDFALGPRSLRETVEIEATSNRLPEE